MAALHFWREGRSHEIHIILIGELLPGFDKAAAVIADFVAKPADVAGSLTLDNHNLMIEAALSGPAWCGSVNGSSPRISPRAV